MARGGYGWAEGGARINDGLKAFVRGEADSQDAGVVAGLRWDMDW